MSICVFQCHTPSLKNILVSSSLNKLYLSLAINCFNWVDVIVNTPLFCVAGVTFISKSFIVFQIVHYYLLSIVVLNKLTM